MRAMSFYKHIVQLTEQFILRCSAEFKVPGLFIIDAIVRQSKQNHQDRDLYGPRFMRNIASVFSSLAGCAPGDKPMITRVLQLWKKGSVFPEKLIAILEELVDRPENPDLLASGESEKYFIFLLSTRHHIRDPH